MLFNLWPKCAKQARSCHSSLGSKVKYTWVWQRDLGQNYLSLSRLLASPPGYLPHTCPLNQANSDGGDLGNETIHMLCPPLPSPLMCTHWCEFHVREDVIKVVELQEFQVHHLMLQLQDPMERSTCIYPCRIIHCWMAVFAYWTKCSVNGWPWTLFAYHNTCWLHITFQINGTPFWELLALSYSKNRRKFVRVLYSYFTDDTLLGLFDYIRPFLPQEITYPTKDGF